MGQFAFGELELSILKAVRELGRATVHEVLKKLASKRSYTTIMTVMSRLAEKGELAREKQGKQYVYWITPHKERASKGLLKRIQDRLFGGKGAAMVSYLIEVSEEMSDQELCEIESMIQQKRQQSKKNG
ncbi:MAG: BlaI family transcriptional regulator [Chlamydiae bacterium CG10_big_fil_rev_8_21_14_0_10_35_9]|nr:MAG: BlaI family transcriptional regulator [Chlamydiae bacterium CG10_big_fil_rev_8_21_14_0_10_35_9]